MNGLSHLEPDFSEFVEVDPTGRYGRYNEILGKGASKTVYRAFDGYEGIEVAWNQVKLYDFLQSPEDLGRLYSEIHLLKTLKHTNIMKFYTSWVDSANRNINFITEMFTSGTLRQYRQKHKRVNIRAVKHWCRQILGGLLYLHSLDPPVIHRDLKCDNIFVNGNQGEVKIGDLGLAAILRKSHAAHCVGTPEFMAPEVYEEEYNELVDIYSFGMCILEMVTFEYPYSECTHPAQIYKKVVSGKKPDALYKVKDQEVRQFVEKCLATVSLRLSARELLKDPFLQLDDCESDLSQIKYLRDFNSMGPILRQPFPEYHHSNSYYGSGYTNGIGYETQNEWDYHHPVEIEFSGIELFEYHEDENSPHVDLSIKGEKREDNSIFLRLKIADKEGRIRNIYFLFDIENDTALSVATEMVAELAISDLGVIEIADMIDGEITSLVPEWKPGLGIEETPRYLNFCYCQDCASNHTSCGSLMDYLSQNPGANLQALQCTRHGCGAAMHGRFEEITYQFDGSEHHVTEDAPIEPNPSEGGSHYYETHESVELSSLGSGESHSHEELDQAISAKDEKENGLMENKSSHENSRVLIKHLSGSRSLNTKDSLPFSLAADSCEKHEEFGQAISAKDEREIRLVENKTAHKNSSNSIKRLSGSRSLNAKDSMPFSLAAEEYENEIQQELRWLKAKYQLELRKLRDQQLGLVPNSSNFHSNSSTRENKTINGGLLTSVSNPLQEDNNGIRLKSSAIDKHFSSNCHAHINKSCPNSDTQRARNCEAIKDSSSSPFAENMVTAKSNFTGSLLPHSLHRTTSLPVDAVDI